MADQSGIIDLSTVKCERSGWFLGVRELIERSEKNHEDCEIPLHDRLDWMENQITSGNMLLYRVSKDGEFLGIITGNVEREFGKPTNFLVMHAVSLKQQSEPFICTLFPVIHELVAKSGLKSWSVRSLRPGMDRRLEQHGFRKIETLYKRTV